MNRNVYYKEHSYEIKASLDAVNKGGIMKVPRFIKIKERRL